MTTCPCNSHKPFADCCEPFISGTMRPKAPEQLMRSRYTAYSEANIDYIQKTMQGKPLIGFNKEQAEFWARNVTWLSLEVIQSYLTKPHQGYVEFIATYMENQLIKNIHELSEFELIDGQWLYVDGSPKGASKAKSIARNVQCPCGSERKFKNCHGK
jgi:SEC-C motif-containing protein